MITSSLTNANPINNSQESWKYLNKALKLAIWQLIICLLILICAIAFFTFFGFVTKLNQVQFGLWLGFPTSLLIIFSVVSVWIHYQFQNQIYHLKITQDKIHQLIFASALVLVAGGTIGLLEWVAAFRLLVLVSNLQYEWKTHFSNQQPPSNSILQTKDLNIVNKNKQTNISFKNNHHRKLTLSKLAVLQLTQDLTYLLNKDKICNLHFTLKHNLQWWLKLRKWNLIWIYSSFAIFFIIGLIICLLQLWYNKEHPYTNQFANPNDDHGIITGRFVCAGLCIWGFYFIILICYTGLISFKFPKITKNYFDIFATAVKEGYLCNDETKYPDVIRMAFYYNDGTMRWRMNNPDSRFKYVMPLWGLVAILSCVKDYQAKYCNVPQLDNQSK